MSIPPPPGRRAGQASCKLRRAGHSRDESRPTAVDDARGPRMMLSARTWGSVMDRRLDDVPEAIRKFAPKERQREPQRETPPEPQREAREPQREAPARAREPQREAPPARTREAYDADSTDAAGQALLAMLQQAARVADENRENAMSLADRLAGELRAVEDRMAQLEAAVAHYKNRAEHAEHWLAQIQREIEQKLIAPQSAGRGGPMH